MVDFKLTLECYVNSYKDTVLGIDVLLLHPCWVKLEKLLHYNSKITWLVSIVAPNRKDKI